MRVRVPNPSQAKILSNCCLTYFVISAKALAEADIALYIGLSVAIIIFSVVAVVVMRVMRRKGSRSGLEAHLGMYDMAPNGKPVNLFRTYSPLVFRELQVTAANDDKWRTLVWGIVTRPRLVTVSC